MLEKHVPRIARVLLVASLLSSFGSAIAAQSAQQPSQPAQQPPAATKPGPTRYHPSVPRRAVMYYSSVWGVDSLDVKWTESGEVIRFSYRVLDPAKAAVL